MSAFTECGKSLPLMVVSVVALGICPFVCGSLSTSEINILVYLTLEVIGEPLDLAILIVLTFSSSFLRHVMEE